MLEEVNVRLEEVNVRLEELKARLDEVTETVNKAKARVKTVKDRVPVVASDDASLLQAGKLHAHYRTQVLSDPYNVDTVICPFLKTAVVSLGLELEDGDGTARKLQQWQKDATKIDTEPRHQDLMTLQAMNTLLTKIQAGPMISGFLQSLPIGLAEHPLDISTLNGTLESTWSTGVLDPLPSESRFGIWKSLATLDGYIGAKEIAQAVPEFKYRALADQAAGDDVGEWAHDPNVTFANNNLGAELSFLLTMFGECGVEVPAVPGCEDRADTCRMKIQDLEQLMLQGRATWQRKADMGNPTHMCVNRLLPEYNDFAARVSV